MGTVTVDLFVSLDGWAGSDGLPGYFGYLGPELQRWIDDELAVPQVLLMGRRTYEVLAGLPEEARDASYAAMTASPKVVFSRTLGEATWSGTRVSDDLLGEVRALGAGGSPARTLGSLSLVRQLAAAGLVDRLRVLTFPLLAGDAGREAAFADLAPADLELLDHRVLDGRLVLTEYRPTGRDIPRA